MTIKKILAFRNDRFGEFLLNIPAFRALKQSFHAYFTLVVNPYIKDIAESIEFVDEIITWENRRHSFSEILRFSKEIKNKKFDLCVIFNPAKEFNIISFLAGIPMRMGYARKWDFLLTHKIKDIKYLGEKHEIEYNLDLVRLVGANIQDKTLSLTIDENIIGDLINELDIKESDNLAAIHPWTSDPIKQWPIINFRELSERLIRELNIKVVIIGGKDELAKSNEFFSNLSSRIINMTGKTTLKELAALLKKCKLLISGDSGPVHMASAVNTPVVAIFRNNIPAKSARRWGPCGEGNIVIKKDNLSDISVEEVFNHVKEVLKK